MMLFGSATSILWPTCGDDLESWHFYFTACVPVCNKTVPAIIVVFVTSQKKLDDFGLVKEKIDPALLEVQKKVNRILAEYKIPRKKGL